MLQRSYAAEPILALACSLDGQYCAGGGPSGSMHLWETPSGHLLRSWPAHYKARSLLPSPGSPCICRKSHSGKCTLAVPGMCTLP